MAHDWHNNFKSAVQRARNITRKLIEQGSSPHEEFQDDWPSTVGVVESVDSEAAPGDRTGTLFVGGFVKSQFRLNSLAVPELEQ